MIRLGLSLLIMIGGKMAFDLPFAMSLLIALFIGTQGWLDGKPSTPKPTKP